MFKAAKTGDVDKLQQMLGEGYSIEERDSSGCMSKVKSETVYKVVNDLSYLNSFILFINKVFW